MQYLDDKELVSTLSIPGTHDSVTYDCHWGQFCRTSQCQSWNIEMQLRAGIRFFDFRTKEQQGKMVTFHGIITFGTLQDNLQQVSHFMRKYPSEFIIMSFRSNGDNKYIDE